MNTLVIDNPTTDEDLPATTRARLQMYLEGGISREHLIVCENGSVFVDEEVIMYELQMRRMYPERPREDYMSIIYPSKIVVTEEGS